MQSKGGKVSKQTAPVGSVYGDAFFAAQVEGSARSAAIVVPLILDLLPDVRSVVDVGCGTGVWLRSFRNAGVANVFGIDGGDAPDGLLYLDPDEFLSADLTQPLPISRRFDVALSLEVAEHLPELHGPRFVDSLCALSDVVVFGAAIPGQGGTGHINERWLSYWAGLFKERGYAFVDLLRPRIWFDDRIEWWYSQNTVVFVNLKRGDLAARFAADLQHRSGQVIDIVHPRCFQARAAARTKRSDAVAGNPQAAPPPVPLPLSWRVKLFKRKIRNALLRLKV